MTYLVPVQLALAPPPQPLPRLELHLATELPSLKTNPQLNPIAALRPPTRHKPQHAPARLVVEPPAGERQHEVQSHGAQPAFFHSHGNFSALFFSSALIS